MCPISCANTPASSSSHAGECHHLARHVDSAAREAKSVDLRQVDKKETESKIIRGKIAGQPRPEFLKMRREGGIVDENEFASQAVAHRVAQIDLLLVGEDGLPRHPLERRGQRARLLGARRYRDQEEQRGQRDWTQEQPHKQHKLNRVRPRGATAKRGRISADRQLPAQTRARPHEARHLRSGSEIGRRPHTQL